MSPHRYIPRPDRLLLIMSGVNVLDIKTTRDRAQHLARLVQRARRVLGNGRMLSGDDTVDLMIACLQHELESHGHE